MTDQEPAPSKESILVVVDTTPHSQACLDLAVELAELRQAKLEVLFVEDVNLVNFAGLPITFEIDPASGDLRNLDEPRLAGEFRSQAHRLEKRLGGIGASRNIRTQMRVVQGQYLNEAFKAVADILFMWSSRRISPMAGGRAQPVRSRHKMSVPSSMVYLYLTDEDDPIALTTVSAELALSMHAGLVIMLSPDAASSPVRQQVTLEVAARNRVPAHVVMTDDGPLDIVRENLSSCSLLVMSKHYAAFHQNEVQALDDLHCPLVLAS